MKPSFLLSACLVLVGLCSGADGTESDTMRCKGGIVSVGDAAAEVLARCGEPVSMAQRVATIEVHSPYRYGDGTDRFYVDVDRWVYNFGPNEFMYELLIEAGGGRVYRIESLDRGY